MKTKILILCISVASLSCMTTGVIVSPVAPTPTVQIAQSATQSPSLADYDPIKAPVRLIVAVDTLNVRPCGNTSAGCSPIGQLHKGDEFWGICGASGWCCSVVPPKSEEEKRCIFVGCTSTPGEFGCE